MNMPEIIAQNGLVKIMLELASVWLLVVVALLAALLGLYTLYFFGKKTVICRKNTPPVKGWERRFYPANIALIILAVFLFVIIRQL